MTSSAAVKPALKLILRVIGTASLTALIFVLAPGRWMEAIHAELGLGALPAQPIVGYLARSTSALYAILGGLFWVLSFDPQRHRSVLIYLGTAIASFGIALVVVDWSEGLPMAWKVWEGPFVTVFGLALLTLSRRLERPANLHLGGG